MTFVGHACDFEHGIFARLDPVAELGNAVRQLLPVDRADLLLELVEGAGFKTAPLAILVLGRVDHDGMGVELRVLRPARRVAEGGNREIAGGLAPDLATVADAGRSHVLFDMGQRHFGRCAVRRDQPLVARDLGHDRNRLGRGQGNVPTRPMLDLAVAGGAELLPADLPLQQRGELLAVNFAFQAQCPGGLAEPFGRGQAAFGIVVVGLVVARRLTGAGQGRNRGNHHTGPGLASVAAAAAISPTLLHSVPAGSPGT